MHNIHIKNLTNGREFSAKFATVDECMSWHSTKKYVHGDSEASPATAEVTITLIDAAPKRLEAAWAAANTLASQIDNNSRTSILWLYNSPTTSESCKAKIEAVQSWWNDIWVEYARVKQLIEAGVDEKYDTVAVGDVPYTIWQISSAR